MKMGGRVAHSNTHVSFNMKADSSVYCCKFPRNHVGNVVKCSYTRKALQESKTPQNIKDITVGFSYPWQKNALLTMLNFTR